MKTSRGGWFLSLALCAAAPFASARSASAQSVQFADGRVLLATVENADGDGLRVRRLDNGGALDLRWDHLSTASAAKWKRAFGLVDDAEEEVLTRAEEVEYLVNGAKRSLIGRIVDRNADAIVVRVKGVDWPVPRADLRVRLVEVPAAQIYTKEEFYVQQRAEARPGDDADKHVGLATTLMAFGDYDRAIEHLQKAKELGNSKDPQTLDQQLARAQRYKEAAKEFALLDDIRAARSRGKLADFEKGLKLIAEFEDKYPQTKIKAEFEREKRRLHAARERYLTQQIADQWRRSIQYVADKKVGEDGFTLQAARDFAENQMTDDIVERLTKQLRLEADEIRTLWGARAEHPSSKRTEYFSYGVGSWVLGEKAILKDTKAGSVGKQQAAPADNGPNIDRFAKLLREALERRQKATQGGMAEQQTEEGWWSDASRAERSTWLRAYYAENGGQLVVTFATVEPCISCFGEGSTLVLMDSKPVKAKCFLCQGTKWVRNFRAY